MKKTERSYNSTLRPRALNKMGEPSKPRKGFKKPTLEELKERGVVVKANTLNEKGSSPRSKAMAKADAAMSRYVRLRAADEDGYLNCFICDKRLHWTEAHNMHFMHRNSGIRYDRIACQAGCATCNSKPLGDRENFGRKLDLRYGAGTAEGLRIKAKAPLRVSTDEILVVANAYAAAVELMAESSPGKFTKR